MQTCDLIVTAAWVLPVAPVNTALAHHGIAISDGRILAIDDAASLSETWRADETLHLDHHILMPGLINAHGHAAMTLLRGAGEDQSLQDWLSDTIWPLEKRLMNAEFVRLGTELAIAEMVQSGTTTFSDMYFFPDVVAAAATDCGVRAQVAFPVIEFANVWSQNVAEGIHKGLALHDEYRRHERIRIAFGPHAPYTVSAANLGKVAMFANEVDAAVQIHLHENAAEVADAMAQHGSTWIEVLGDAGLLGPNLQAVHMTQVNDHDLTLIADSQTRVVHCPTSNLKLASGYCPVGRLREAGIRVALGTDGAASNNDLDLFQEMRLAALLAKHQQGDARAGNARDVVAMATLGGAQVLGMDAHIGSLEAGKDADFISIDTRALSMQPLHDPFAALVHGVAGQQVDNVFVRGEAVMRDRALCQQDADDLRARVQHWHREHFHEL